MKKINNLVLASLLICSLASVPTMANEVENFNAEQDSYSIETYKDMLISNPEKLANLDTKSVSPEVKAMILQSRSQIIFSEASWTVDGRVTLTKADGTVQTLPKFSDLYPNWDLYEISQYINSKENSDNDETQQTYSYIASKEKPDNNKIQQTRSASFANNVAIPLAKDDSAGNTFYTFNSGSSSRDTYAKTLPGDKFNIGYKNVDTGEFLNWMANISTYDVCTLDGEDGVRYSVRCSTYDKAGQGYICVE